MPLTESNFRWDGEGIATQRRKPKELHYQAFQHGKLRVEIGDFVLVRNDESMDPEDCMNCFVAQINDLYDTGEKEEPYRAKVQWFSRIFELPPQFTRQLSNVDYKKELVEEHRVHWENTVDAESIFHKCLVTFLPEDANSETPLPHLDKATPSFFCRYTFTGISFTPKISKSEKKNILNGKNDANSYPSKSTNLGKSNTARARSSTKSSKTRSASPVIPLQSPTTKKERKPTRKTNVNSLNTKALKICVKKIDDLVLETQQPNCRIIVAPGEDLAAVNETSESKTKLKSNLNRKSTAHDSDEKIHLGKRKNKSNKKSSQFSSDTDVSEPGEKKYKAPIIHSFIVAEEKETKNTESKLQNTPQSKVLKLDTVNKNVGKGSEKSYRKKDALVPKQQRSLRGQKSTLSSAEKKLQSVKSVFEYSDDEVQEIKIKPALTRSGRKTKSVGKSKKTSKKGRSSSQSPPKKPQLKRNGGLPRRNSKFYHSDESDSGSAYTASEDSSSDESENVSDASLDLVKKNNTPRSAKKSSCRTPRAKVANVTPSLPERQQPLATPKSLLEESRQRLHVSAVPNSLPCREEEFSDIYTFVESNLSNYTGGCMYISGVPGTGKTATVHEVMRNLQKERDEGSLPPFQFVEVNGMKMTDPYQCYVQIFKKLTGDKIASQQAANLLEKRFTQPGPRKDAVVLLVDELDKLWTRKQTVMYNIFDWPTKPSSKLIVLAIANTMDLPERLMMSRISSRLGLTRKTFQPYTFRELQEIVMCRIAELQVFDPDAVQLVARKVAAVSGDARRALEICRRAAEVAEEGSVIASPTKKRKLLVGMAHVDAALKQMFTSPMVAAIRGASELQKLFFKAILSEFQRTGFEESTLSKSYHQLVALCRFEGLHPPTTSEVSTMCAHLASSHLILIDNIQSDLYMKIRLNVSSDDVNYALTGQSS